MVTKWSQKVIITQKWSPSGHKKLYFTPKNGHLTQFCLKKSRIYALFLRNLSGIIFKPKKVYGLGGYLPPRLRTSFTPKYPLYGQIPQTDF